MAVPRRQPLGWQEEQGSSKHPASQEREQKQPRWQQLASLLQMTRQQHQQQQQQW
jgi:hypothetical protein